MTFSISARCPDTGMFAIAISSSSPAVAARCAHARAGVGVVATQNITDPSLGPKGLNLMQQGLSAKDALKALLDGYPTAEWRQVALVDKDGGVAKFSGAHTLGTHAMAEGQALLPVAIFWQTQMFQLLWWQYSKQPKATLATVF